MTESHVVDLLTKAKAKYKDLAKRDIIRALLTFRELSANLENYVFANGATSQLLTLTGTIPVQYKSNRYNIPVQFYFLDMFPYNPPMCYVRPTSDMSVNVSETVDANGRINIPYLQEWKFPSSDLSQLIYKLVAKFSETTPLFAKTSRSTAQQYPGSQKPTSSVTPPYPTQPTYPTPNVQSGGSSLPYPTQTAFPTAQPTPYPTYQQSPYMPSYPYMPPGGYPQQPSPISMPAPSSSSSIRPPIPPAPQTSSLPQPPTYPGVTNTRPSYEDTIKPEYYKMSLISAIEDRVRYRLHDLIDQTSGEMESLRKSSHDLEVGEKRLQYMINDAETEIDNIKRYTNELKQKIAIINEDIGKIKHRDNSNIEDAVVAPAPLYRQIMQLFSEELALQDLIYFLNEGLEHKTVSLDVFLKQVRFLSRKQFMVRALIQKCREQAGLRA